MYLLVLALAVACIIFVESSFVIHVFRKTCGLVCNSVPTSCRMSEEFGTKWHALEADEEKFDAWAEKAQNGKFRDPDTIIEIDLNDDSIQGQVAIVSWRWGHPLPEQNIDRIRLVHKKIVRHGYKIFLIDLVSVDQSKGADKIHQVHAFTKLYETLPVISFYPVDLKQGYQQRGWINFEKGTYLENDREHKSTAIMPEFKGVVSGLKLKSLFGSIYGAKPKRVPGLLFLSYDGWYSFLTKVDSRIKRRPPKEAEGAEDKYVVTDDRPVLLMAFLAGTYFTNYLDGRFTWVALTEKHQLRLPEHVEAWGIEEEEGILLMGMWWLTQLVILGKKKSITLGYKRERTEWAKIQENFEKRGFEKLATAQSLVWSNDNIKLAVGDKTITCMKISSNAHIDDWAIDVFELLFPV